jgi:hypothetical protein
MTKEKLLPGNIFKLNHSDEIVRIISFDKFEVLF